MRDFIKKHFSDIRGRFKFIDSEEEKLEQDEEKENKYLKELENLQDSGMSKGKRNSLIKSALSNFSEETEIANDLAENLIAIRRGNRY